MNRRLLGVLAVGLLFATAGCTGFFAEDVTDDDLDEEPPEGEYDWNTTQDVTIVIEDQEYTAVYDLNGTTELNLFSRGFTSNSPLSFRALRYRYPNGTVITGSNDAVTVERSGSTRDVTVPNGSGMVAFTAGAGGKRFGTPAYLEGSYEVVLPPDARTRSLLFGDVAPGGYQTSVDDRNRLHIVWDDVSSAVLVRYYLQRDVLIFRGLLVVVGVIGGVGLVYLYRQVRRLQKRREELGLDVDTDDDLGGGGPQPGMR